MRKSRKSRNRNFGEVLRDAALGVRDARLRTAWEAETPNYQAAIIEAYLGGDPTRLVDLLRAQRVPNGEDLEHLGDYIEALHRLLHPARGRPADAALHDKAMEADAVFDFWRRETGDKTVPDWFRQAVYYRLCGIDPGKADDPEKLDDAEVARLDDVEKLSEFVRKGRHR